MICVPAVPALSALTYDLSEKAYKRKFEEWGLTKNVPKEEGLFMVRKREERREQGKETIFWRRRRPEGPLQLVPDDKVDRIADRYSHDLNSFFQNGEGRFSSSFHDS